MKCAVLVSEAILCRVRHNIVSAMDIYIVVHACGLDSCGKAASMKNHTHGPHNKSGMLHATILCELALHSTKNGMRVSFISLQLV